MNPNFSGIHFSWSFILYLKSYLKAPSFSAIFSTRVPLAATKKFYGTMYLIVNYVG